MRLKEQKLWDSMRAKAPGGLWLQRVENLVGDGIPDVLVGGANWSWVELKAPRRPKRLATPFMGKMEGLRQSQINWHIKAASMRLVSYVLIRDVDQKELLLIPGILAGEMNSMGIDALREVSVAGSWEEIFEELGK